MTVAALSERAEGKGYRVGQQLRHEQTGETGTLMGLGNSGNLLVMRDGSEGREYLSYPPEQWTEVRE